ncbi:hypothetical protein D3C71_1166340 [compost metagenome]
MPPRHLQLRGDRRLHGLAHRAHRIAQPSDFIAAAEADILGQITLGHPRRQFHRTRQWRCQAAAEQHGCGNADHQCDAAQDQQPQQGPFAQFDRGGGGLTALLFFVGHPVVQRPVPAIGSFLHGAKGERRRRSEIALPHELAHLLVEWLSPGTPGGNRFGDGGVLAFHRHGLIDLPAGLIARHQGRDAGLVTRQAIALTEQHLAAHHHHFIVGIEHVREHADFGDVDLDDLLHRILLQRTASGANDHHCRDQHQQQAKTHPQPPHDADVAQTIHDIFQTR